MPIPVSARLRPHTGVDPDKYRAEINVTITPHSGYIDLTQAERQTVLDAAVIAVRAALPEYTVSATITSQDTVTA